MRGVPAEGFVELHFAEVLEVPVSDLVEEVAAAEHADDGAGDMVDGKRLEGDWFCGGRGEVEETHEQMVSCAVQVAQDWEAWLRCPIVSEAGFG